MQNTWGNNRIRTRVFAGDVASALIFFTVKPKKEINVKRELICIAVLAIIGGYFLTPPVFAASKEVIYANYKYVLGDSDTKSDAKKIAFIEAKRLCLEKAGVYLESNTEVLNSQLSIDQIKTYTGGILKVEIVSEQFKKHLRGRCLLCCY